MFPNRIALAAVVVACVAAAAGGGYLATRHNVASMAAPDAAAASAPASTQLQPVQETEALVGAPLTPESAPSASLPATAIPSPARRRAPASVPVASSRRKGADAVPARTAEKPPSLERSWPSGSSTSSSSSTAVSADAQEPATHLEERQADTPRAPDPPAKSFQELVVAADSVVGLQTESALSSEMSRVEDPIEARVVRDVHVGGEVAIPAGTRALGTVISVERGGKFKERARLGIRFQTLVLADGTRLPMTTDTIYRYGDAPGNGTAARIGGGAVVGAIIGGIIGGGKGAAIGATTGAGAGTASVMTSDRSAAVFPKGTEVTARILSPVTVTIEK
jgi:hypothetical protein